MKTDRALLITLIAIATMGGCRKTEPLDVSPPPDPPTPNEPVFEALFADNVEDARQDYALNAAAGGQVIAAKGTQLIFEPGAFLYANGTPVTGQVEVSIVEALTIGDMIWLNKQTVGNDNGVLRMLRSGGAINVSATQGGSTLGIAQGGLIVRIPTAVGDPAMQLFRGSEDVDGNMVWNPIDSSSVTVDPGYYFDPYYVFAADSLYWINCDYFYNYPNITPITATIPVGQSTDSTTVWLALPTENAVTNMHHASGQTYDLGAGYEVPVGMQAVVVGLQVSANGYYSSFSTVTISANMNVPMTFSPTTLPQFQAALDAL